MFGPWLHFRWGGGIEILRRPAGALLHGFRYDDGHLN